MGVDLLPPIGLTLTRGVITMETNYPPAYERYNTQYGGALETVGFSLYDSQIYDSTVTTLLTYFTTVQATIARGNLQIAGALANPNAFLIRAIRFYSRFRPWDITTAATGNPQTGALDDQVQLLNSGTLILTIGAKNYGQWPLWMITAGGGAVAQGFTGVTLSTGGVTNGHPDPRAVYSLAKPLFIAPQISFKVDIQWPAALTLTQDDIAHYVVLDGDLLRPVQ